MDTGRSGETQTEIVRLSMHLRSQELSGWWLEEVGRGMQAGWWTLPWGDEAFLSECGRFHCEARGKFRGVVEERDEK